jgi:hypothetical protein
MAYEITGGAYYARILDPRTYGAVTQDILARNAHPFVLDSKILCPVNNYTFSGINKYYEEGVQVTLTTKVSNNCVLGEDTKLGVNT